MRIKENKLHGFCSKMPGTFYFEFVTVPQLKPWCSPKAGREGSMCNRLPHTCTHLHTGIQVWCDLSVSQLMGDGGGWALCHDCATAEATESCAVIMTMLQMRWQNFALSWFYYSWGNWILCCGGWLCYRWSDQILCCVWWFCYSRGEDILWWLWFSQCDWVLCCLCCSGRWL